MCFIAYMSINDKKKIDSSKNEESKNSVKFLNIEENNNKIVEKFEVELNGKVNSLKIEFSYNRENDEFGNGEYQEVAGTFGSEIVFSIAGHSDTLDIKKWYYDANRLKTAFNESNFKIIDGSDDKKYLLLITRNQSAMQAPTTDYLYIYDDSLHLIEKLIIRDGTVGWELEGNAYPWYMDQFNTCKDQNICHIRTKVEANNIYYLDHVQDEGFGSIEEKIYTIKNGKLESRKINTYKISAPAYGQAP